MLGEKDRDLAVVRTGGSATDPDRRSRREEPVEVALVVVADARREDARLEIGRGNEGALQLRDRVEARALTGARAGEQGPPAAAQSRGGARPRRCAARRGRATPSRTWPAPAVRRARPR